MSLYGHRGPIAWACGRWTERVESFGFRGMRKPKHYDTWHRRGVEWCRQHMAGNVTHGESMRAYIDYENWRVANAERLAALRGWVAVAIPGVVATVSALAMGAGARWPNSVPLSGLATQFLLLLTLSLSFLFRLAGREGHRTTIRGRRRTWPQPRVSRRPTAHDRPVHRGPP